jgi:hypothetical protein
VGGSLSAVTGFAIDAYCSLFMGIRFYLCFSWAAFAIAEKSSAGKK